MDYVINGNIPAQQTFNYLAIQLLLASYHPAYIACDCHSSKIIPVKMRLNVVKYWSFKIINKKISIYCQSMSISYSISIENKLNNWVQLSQEFSIFCCKHYQVFGS